MTILQALDRYYHRLDGVAGPGWSPEKFGWCIVLDRDGDVVDVEDRHDMSGKKPQVKTYVVPAAVKRTVGIAPNFLWDKSAYVLSRTAGEGKRTAQEHAAFVALHLKRLASQEDEGLVALRRFLENWQPEMFDEIDKFKPEMLDTNIMFRLEGERGYLHDRPAARALVEAKADDDGADESKGKILCLVTGEMGKPARLHPTIKGVEGAQSSGAALVSFNLDAFTSLGKEQGANAPTSEAAAFRYGAALNHLLTRDGPNRIRRPIGDATVVFWADASDAKAAEAADDWFATLLAGDITDEQEAAKIKADLEALAKGRPLAEMRPAITPGTRFHILGLSPNAARLSVRYWLTDTLDQFARRLADHHADLSIDPLPTGWGAAPSVNRLLARTTALQEKFENIPPLLAGEVMRAILSGGRYPQSLLAAAVIRLRAGDDPLSGWHPAIIRAVLHRDFRLGFQQKDVPMGLAPDEPNTAYQLGRLFAVLETAQRMALGRINASIRDRYFGAASATPASVFPLLLRGAQNHLGKLRKTGKGGWIEREIEDILDKLSLDLPRAFPLAEQGRFAVGYYHQRKDQFKARPEAAADLEAAETTTEQGDDQ